MKFRNIKTGEKRVFPKGELTYCPYLQTITSGICAGHTHVDAYWDKEGNEWSRVYDNYIVGAPSKLICNYNKKTLT